jgi:hypothetical protein
MYIFEPAVTVWQMSCQLAVPYMYAHAAWPEVYAPQRRGRDTHTSMQAGLHVDGSCSNKLAAGSPRMTACSQEPCRTSGKEQVLHRKHPHHPQPLPNRSPGQ